MRVVLIVLGLAVATLAAPGYSPIFKDYHVEIGIPKAARIKAAEEAVDFDGSRIFGGEPSALGQFPFMAGLLIHLESGGTSVCGSSLLTNTRLVTAAHCWIHGAADVTGFTVVLGSILLFSGGTRIYTNDVEVHAGYNANNLNNDIAIIRITPVTFSNIIAPIQLASGNNDYAGSVAIAAGFGIKGDMAGIPITQYLSHTRLPVLTNEECRRRFGPWVVIDSTLCTSGVYGSICSSDSGGPLQLGNILIGVSSFGVGFTCEAGDPMGFARVTAFNAWIRARL